MTRQHSITASAFQLYSQAQAKTCLLSRSKLIATSDTAHVFLHWLHPGTFKSHWLYREERRRSFWFCDFAIRTAVWGWTSSPTPSSTSPCHLDSPSIYKGGHGAMLGHGDENGIPMMRSYAKPLSPGDTGLPSSSVLEQTLLLSRARVSAESVRHLRVQTSMASSYPSQCFCLDVY